LKKKSVVDFFSEKLNRHRSRPRADKTSPMSRFYSPLLILCTVICVFAQVDWSDPRVFKYDRLCISQGNVETYHDTFFHVVLFLLFLFLFLLLFSFSSFSTSAYFYASTNPDLTNFDQNQAENHWVKHGIDEGRQASGAFHSSQYLARYADIQAACNGNHRCAVQHYIQHGYAEGRLGFAQDGGPCMIRTLSNCICLLIW
jgi:hypothetical protein